MWRGSRAGKAVEPCRNGEKSCAVWRRQWGAFDGRARVTVAASESREPQPELARPARGRGQRAEAEGGSRGGRLRGRGESPYGKWSSKLEPTLPGPKTQLSPVGT